MPSSTLGSTSSMFGSFSSGSPVVMAGIGAAAYAGYNIYNTMQTPVDCPKGIKSMVNELIEVKNDAGGFTNKICDWSKDWNTNQNAKTNVGNIDKDCLAIFNSDKQNLSKRELSIFAEALKKTCKDLAVTNVPDIDNLDNGLKTQGLLSGVAKRLIDGCDMCKE